jgi:hypothetical protein
MARLLVSYGVHAELPRAHHAVYALGRLGEHQLIDPPFARATREAMRVIALFPRHNRLFRDGLLADEALLLAAQCLVASYLTWYEQSPQTGLPFVRSNKLVSAETFSLQLAHRKQSTCHSLDLPSAPSARARRVL